MKKFLIVVDMQKDFVDGSLGTKEAQGIVQNVCEKIKSFQGEIIVTFDTHNENYLETAEGRKLPVKHCIKGTEGFELDENVSKALEGKDYTALEKPTFGSVLLPEIIKEKADGEVFTAELVGLCTDICVVSNALLIKANFPESEIFVDSSCCAGVTPDSHNSALNTMRSCQINVM
ncbi:MAG: cysteine hydrolase [Clostridia bacterium]|nr:cysteine hydrolase [Clostridia bacterium]